VVNLVVMVFPVNQVFGKFSDKTILSTHFLIVAERLVMLVQLVHRVVTVCNLIRPYEHFSLLNFVHFKVTE
jgi:hypothetical protein